MHTWAARTNDVVETAPGHRWYHGPVLVSDGHCVLARQTEHARTTDG